jgi:hypothetical protein
MKRSLDLGLNNGKEDVASIQYEGVEVDSVSVLEYSAVSLNGIGFILELR